MAKPFRKLEVLLEGTVYVFDRAGAELLLAQFNAADAVCGAALRQLRDDLSRALATETEAPAAENPFPPDEAEQALIDVARENAEACGDCRDPRCRFCDAPGKRIEGRKDDAGRVVEWYYLCETPNCIAARAASPLPLRLFAGGAV